MPDDSSETSTPDSSEEANDDGREVPLNGSCFGVHGYGNIQDILTTLENKKMSVSKLEIRKMLSNLTIQIKDHAMTKVFEDHHHEQLPGRVIIHPKWKGFLSIIHDIENANSETNKSKVSEISQEEVNQLRSFTREILGTEN